MTIVHDCPSPPVFSFLPFPLPPIFFLFFFWPASFHSMNGFGAKFWRLGSPMPVPSECLPRAEKIQTSSGFKYRLFFACGPHAVHRGTGETEDKPSYLLPSSRACNQFLRQLVWPATIDVFETSRIRYIGGGGKPPVTLRSLLILRKRDTSDSRPTMTFELKLQSYTTVTYLIREFLPLAGVSGVEYPEITLRFNAKKGHISLSRSGTVEELYRECSSKAIVTQWDGLVIQFPSQNGRSDPPERSATPSFTDLYGKKKVLKKFVEACNSMHAAKPDRRASSSSVSSTELATFLPVALPP